MLPSIELARDELRRQGPTLDEKAVHRMSRQLGAEVLATRTRDLRRYREGRLPAGQEMSGQHVVAQVVVTENPGQKIISDQSCPLGAGAQPQMFVVHRASFQRPTTRCHHRP